MPNPGNTIIDVEHTKPNCLTPNFHTWSIKLATSPIPSTIIYTETNFLWVNDTRCSLRTLPNGVCFAILGTLRIDVVGTGQAVGGGEEKLLS